MPSISTLIAARIHVVSANVRDEVTVGLEFEWVATSGLIFHGSAVDSIVVTTTADATQKREELSTSIR
ncbi:hypothetical protein SAMN05661093_07784 [Kibdelosporangium aridum]|uniref:Uncharacterized protein n=1 Tax=Kibdelosporangium aridum TaxID=2030 RepID=A0A1Y5Y2Q0_KIBAR|nr:hypothetical protein SAMN05661093_07784 [Kibdelosporangium aridum]